MLPSNAFFMRFRFHVCTILLSAVLFSAPRVQAQSAPPTTLFFDDFSAGHLDTAHWGYENDGILVSRMRLGNTPTFGRDSDGTPNVASGISGTANSAAHVDIEIKRLSDGAFWNGWVWMPDETAIPSLLAGTSWKVVAPASNGAGLPSGTDLGSGAYQLEADAYDASGNVAIATRSVSVSPLSASSRSAGAS